MSDAVDDLDNARILDSRASLLNPDNEAANTDADSAENGNVATDESVSSEATTTKIIKVTEGSHVSVSQSDEVTADNSDVTTGTDDAPRNDTATPMGADPESGEGLAYVEV